MTRALLIRCLLAFVVVTCHGIAPDAAEADPITITSGVFNAPGNTLPSMRFQQNATLASLMWLDGSQPLGLSHVLNCPAGGCAFGSTVDLSGSFNWAPGDRWFVQGAIVDGVQYVEPIQFVSDDLPRFVGSLEFDAGDALLPPDPRNPDPSVAWGQAPFTFRGSLSAYAATDVDHTSPLFQVDLVGRGTAQFTADDFDVVTRTYREAGVAYRFEPASAPVPEPTTLMLLGTGIAGLAGRAWRRKSM